MLAHGLSTMPDADMVRVLTALRVTSSWPILDAEVLCLDPWIPGSLNAHDQE